jgi:hypothetical protein
MMLTCGTRMQSGQFREAFLDAESALDLLRTFLPPPSPWYWRMDSRCPPPGSCTGSVPDVNAVLKPLKICIDYKLAILLLMEIDTFSKYPQQTPGALPVLNDAGRYALA